MPERAGLSHVVHEARHVHVARSPEVEHRLRDDGVDLLTIPVPDEASVLQELSGGIAREAECQCPAEVPA